MKSGTAYKIFIDIAMTVLLFLQMAYMLTGQEVHEWLGISMFVLVIVHNALNRTWYRNLFKGKYTALRYLQTAINLLMAVSMFGLAVSGMMMSRHMLEFFRISSGMSFARELHMVASYWGFVLMSLHLGLHWNFIMGLTGKVAKTQDMPTSLQILLRGMAILIATYGMYAFIKHNLLSYMLLKNKFVFFDFAQPALSFIADYLAMLGLWGSLSHYAKWLLSIQFKKTREGAEP